MPQIIKDAKMTVTDKISWLGGMFGLFTGFSLISGFEILYWIFFKVIFKKSSVIQEEPKKQDIECQCGKREKEDDVSKTYERRFIAIEQNIEMLQLRSKQAHLEDSAAGAFFDAIFNDTIHKKSK